MATVLCLVGSATEKSAVCHGKRERCGALLESVSMRNWLFAMALVAAVFLAYQPAWRGGFIFDDDLHLLNNPVLKPAGLARAWTPGGYINYWPLTFTVYRLEFEAWELNLFGFHLVNIALHAASALLLWRALVELDVPGAMVTAAIFALHPVNVESVAWIAQLKGLLSMFFALVAALFYLQFDRRGGRWSYAASVVAFFLSTLSKGMVLTLPVVLLACAWWRRGLVDRRDLLRILPYLVIGAFMTGVEIWSQRGAQAGENMRSGSLGNRIAVAGCAVWFYLGKLLWPFNLCFVYPRWKIDGGDFRSYLPGLLLVLLLALAWWRRRSWGRSVVMLIVCCVSLLLPALGFVPVAFMRFSLVADHYQYAAMAVPIAALIGVAAATIFRAPARRPLAYSLSLVLLTFLAFLTWRQSRIYANSDKLWNDTLAKNPDAWLAHNNLGYTLASSGELRSAVAHFRKALESDPDYVDALKNLGNVLAKIDQIDEAIDLYRRALQLSPGSAEIHYDLGLELARRGEVDDAIVHFQRALEINPDHVDAHINLGVIRVKRGQFDDAIVHYRRALEIAPNNLEAHYNLASALASERKVDEALEHYEKALGLALTQNDEALADRIRLQINRLRKAP